MYSISAYRLYSFLIEVLKFFSSKYYSIICSITMILKSLLLICCIALVIVSHSMTVESRHIILKRDSMPCTVCIPQIQSSTTSHLLKLQRTLEDLENTVENLQVSYSFHLLHVNNEAIVCWTSVGERKFTDSRFDSRIRNVNLFFLGKDA